MQSTGGSFRSRLGSYADVLRTVVMQQIVDAGGSLNGLELEEIEVCIQCITSTYFSNSQLHVSHFSKQLYVFSILGQIFIYRVSVTVKQIILLI